MKSLVALIVNSIRAPKTLAEKPATFLGQTTALKQPDDSV